MPELGGPERNDSGDERPHGNVGDLEPVLIFGSEEE
jgi:hypothetical protein